jgi:hypothetical protein
LVGIGVVWDVERVCMASVLQADDVEFQGWVLEELRDCVCRGGLLVEDFLGMIEGSMMVMVMSLALLVFTRAGVSARR